MLINQSTLTGKCDALCLQSMTTLQSGTRGRRRRDDATEPRRRRTRRAPDRRLSRRRAGRTRDVRRDNVAALARRVAGGGRARRLPRGLSRRSVRFRPRRSRCSRRVPARTSMPWTRCAWRPARCHSLPRQTIPPRSSRGSPRSSRRTGGCGRGQEPVAPRPDLGHAANYLYMLDGREPDAERVRGARDVPEHRRRPRPERVHVHGARHHVHRLRPRLGGHRGRRRAEGAAARRRAGACARHGLRDRRRFARRGGAPRARSSAANG